MSFEVPTEIVVWFLGIMGTLLIALVLVMIKQLSNIGSDVKVLAAQMVLVVKDVDEIKEEGDRMWQKLSEHDLDIDRLKSRVSLEGGGG